MKELEGEAAKLRDAIDPLKRQEATAQADIRSLKMDKG